MSFFHLKSKWWHQKLNKGQWEILSIFFKYQVQIIRIDEKFFAKIYYGKNESSIHHVTFTIVYCHSSFIILLSLTPKLRRILSM